MNKNVLKLAMTAGIVCLLLSVFAMESLGSDDNDDSEGTAASGGEGPELGYWSETYSYEGEMSGGPEFTCHKYHWMMQPGAVKVRGVLDWKDTLQDVDFAIGIGDCPDSGETVVEDSGGHVGNGEGHVEIETEDGEEALHVDEGEEVKWFAHINSDPITADCHYTIELTITYYGELE